MSKSDLKKKEEANSNERIHKNNRAYSSSLLLYSHIV